MGWPAKHDRWLTRSFAKGLSFAQMSAKTLSELGVHYSRNSCIGKAHRLKLAQADKPQAKRERPATPKPWEATGKSKRTYYRHKQTGYVPPKPKPKPEPRHFACDPATGVRVADVVPLNISIYDLTDHTCRWPYGDVAPYTYCGCWTFEGSSYCDQHTALSTSLGTRSEQMATRGLERVS